MEDEVQRKFETHTPFWHKLNDLTKKIKAYIAQFDTSESLKKESKERRLKTK